MIKGSNGFVSGQPMGQSGAGYHLAGVTVSAVLAADTVTPALLCGYSICHAVERCTGREHKKKCKSFKMFYY